MCMSIEFMYSKINQGATWGVIFSLFVIFVKDLQPYVHTNTCAFVYFVFMTICVLNVMVTTACPKYVETGEDRQALITTMLHSSPLEGPLPSNPDEKEKEKKARLLFSNEPKIEVPEIMDRGLENLLPSVSLNRQENINMKTKKNQKRDVEEGK